MSIDRRYAHIDDAVQHVVCFTPDRSVEQIASDAGIPVGRLREAADPTRPQPFHARWIGPVSRSTKRDDIVEHICRDAGGIFIKLPDVTHGQHVDLAQCVGDAMREFADVVQTTGAALQGDGVIDAHEREQLLQEVIEAEAKLGAMKALVVALPTQPSAKRTPRGKR